MLHAQRHDAGVVHPGTGDVTLKENFLKYVEVSLLLTQERQPGRAQESLHRKAGRVNVTWRIEDARVGDDGEKFVNTGPRNREVNPRELC